MTLFKNGDIVLFQGDSITDAGRDRQNSYDMGHGYASIASSWFQATHPEIDVTFLNRGIGGNVVSDLRERWEEDIIALKPTWVSLLIGINNTWRRYSRDLPTSLTDFVEDYRVLLEETLTKTQARLILCEPFVLPTPEDREAWREDLDPKIDAIRKLAREFKALYVPFDGVFAEASMLREPAFWAGDGVHPSPAGHALMAQAWLRTVKAL